MYVIPVYGCGEKRVAKTPKGCLRYLNRIQNSVFEGDLTKVKLKEPKLKVGKIMDRAEDSVILFASRRDKWPEKEIPGRERGRIDNFL
jgi:CRISPR-associated protein Cas2